MSVSHRPTNGSPHRQCLVFKKWWALTTTLATPLNTRAIALHRPSAQWVSGYVISFHPCPGARVFSTQSGTGDMGELHPLPSLMPGLLPSLLPGPRIRQPCALL